MVKKSILKDALREIKLTRKRFFSILLIIALGVGFYVGLKSTPLDMEKTAKNYYEETNLMDLKIVSSTGFSKDDWQTIKDISDVKGVMLVKSVDAKTTIKNKDYVIKVNGINKNRSTKSDDYINRLALTSGRHPSTINEGLVEESFLKDNDLKLGDLVTLNPENENSLRAKRIKIVGTIRSSYYSSNDRGSSNLGNGKINYYMYVEENDFGNNYYSEGYITFKDSYKYDTYSNDYKDYVNSKKESIINAIASKNNERYNVITGELNANITYIQERLNNLYSSDVPQESLNDLIKETSNQLTNAKTELAKVPAPSTYAFSRNETSSFYEYKLETERIENIARVFPAIFFLVAALVSLTAMTRIVEEERVQLGILRAMGYGKFDVVFKYILYAFLASIIGSVLGSLLFYKFVPIIVATCYGTFYEMPSLITSFQINHAMFASICACGSTILATILVFIKDMRKTPATLMRPEAPKPGKRVLIERVEFIWKKLSFSNKVTFRNVFRYKKRLLMTVTGICGCSALLLTAFGLKDSINSIVSKQFGKINKYDMSVNINAGANQDDLNKLEKSIIDSKSIKEILKVNNLSVSLKNKDISETATIIIPESKEKINNFISLQSRKGKNIKLLLSDDGIIISEKLSRLLNVKKGNTVQIIIDSTTHDLKVSGITENYVEHYVYMSPTLYEKIYGKKTIYNVILTKNKKLNSNEENGLSKEVMSIENVTSATLSSDVKKGYKDSMSTLTYVTFILMIAAAALAFVVLYNLSNINISERKRELATIKVLGFYDKEVTNYIHKETIILTMIGASAGLILGSFLTYYVVKACETNLFMFSFGISFLSYLLSFLITIIFLFIVNIFMHFDLKKLDMIEALKSVE